MINTQIKLKIPLSEVTISEKAKNSMVIAKLRSSEIGRNHKNSLLYPFFLEKYQINLLSKFFAKVLFRF